MKNFNYKRFLLIFLIIVSAIAADQISKIIVRDKVDYFERIEVVGKVVTLEKVENTGAFLGLGNSLPRIYYKILMIYIPLLVIGYALFWLLRQKNLNKMMDVGVSFIVAGGIGNIIDRFIYGSVTDFLYFDFYIFHTGIVNFADMILTTGFFMLIYEIGIKPYILKYKNAKKED